MNAPARRARLLVVAATGTARKRTLPALAGSAVVEVVALQARSEEKGKLLADTTEVPYFSSIEDMANSVAADFAFIGSPPFLHLEHIEAIASHGLPILCEKPIATSLSDAKRIADIVENKAVPFGLAHHLRHQPMYDFAKGILAEGTLGRVRRASAQWSFALNRSSPNASWKLRPEVGGRTAFSDAGIHAIDLLVGLFGAPTGVQASALSLPNESVASDAVAIFTYLDSGMLATVSASQNSLAPSNDLVIEGDAGTLVVRHGLNEAPAAEAIVSTASGTRKHVLPPTNPYAREVEDFAKSIMSGTEFTGTTLKDAMLGTRIIDAIEVSIDTGASVSL